MKREIKKKMGLMVCEQRTMDEIKGGTPGDDGQCHCGCLYVNCGGSSSQTNDSTNDDFNLKSPDRKPC